jgi:serine/threonine protein phosphatase PrpC
MSSLSIEFSVEPGFGPFPIPHHRFGRYFQDFRRLLYAEAPEVSQLHHPTPARIERRQLVHRFIERHQLCRAFFGNHQRFVQRNLTRLSAAFVGMARARHTHQNPPHQLSRNREEMRAVLPLHSLLPNQLYRNDYLLLCSDGLSNKITPQEMWQALWRSNSISETCRKLIDEANQRGGEDNITVIVARFDGDALPIGNEEQPGPLNHEPISTEFAE